MLLNEYYECIQMVGPMKKFRNNTAIWSYISDELRTKLGSNKSSEQCSTKLVFFSPTVHQSRFNCIIIKFRWKTIKRTNTSQRQSNKETGKSRTTVDHEDQFNKISAIDDALEPEVLRCPTSVTYKRTTLSPQAEASLDSPSSSSSRSSTSPAEGPSPGERTPSFIRRRKRASSTNQSVNYMMAFFAAQNEKYLAEFRSQYEGNQALEKNGSLYHPGI